MIKNFEQFINERYDYSQHEETFPSKETGEDLGLSWLYNDWKLPDNMTPDELGKLVMRKNDIIQEVRKGNKVTAEKIITDLYNKLIVLNPELKNIRYKNIGNALDLLFGALSKFNYDDIKFFTEHTSKELIAYNHKNNKRSGDLQSNLGVDISWVMSPVTFKKMEALPAKYHFS